MPTENEKKFVISMKTSTALRDYLVEHKASRFDIRQGYLFSKKRSCLRIREKCAPNTPISFSMTYKKNTGSRILEIETQISQRDFLELWQKSKSRLRKNRYEINGWEFDFFLYYQEAYFVLVEHEMPEGQAVPSEVPDIVKKHLIFEVPDDDVRFSSRKLSDSDYAKDLYKSVIKESSHARSRERRQA